ncbi:MAG TPA: methyltransferase domain-containing protein [Bryobacteraceae bacterium]|nr:methyltransferase domain-containing protein [Bryobacteraceae bacterium]
MTERVNVVELLEDPSLPEHVVAKAYRDLARTQCLLRNTAAIFRRLGKKPGKVLDLGCGQGALLEEIRDKLGVEVIGFDLRPAPAGSSIPILTGNAAVDPLPEADVAISICLAHHLSEDDVIGMIRNVSRSCRRLIVLDLVRHWMPLTLFRVFMSPFLHPINAADGITSIKRSYTPRELRAMVDEAVTGTNASVVHTVAPFYIRQVVEITWR